MFENYSINDSVNVPINGTRRWYGDESLNTRLTLVWNPTDTFQAKLKYSYSEYDNDGAGTAWTDEYCPEGVAQPTAAPAASAAFVLVQGIDDCKINGNTSKLNLNPALRAGLPGGYDDGEPGLSQETDFVSLLMDWDFNEAHTLTSVTGWVDLKHDELDDYSYGAGIFGGLHFNSYESLSQEFRLASNYDSAVNFQAGILWQEIEQIFDAYQYAFNLGVIAGPDPVTGWGYDYNKKHFLDTEVFSGFAALYWDINERTELTVGARYTDEEKDGRIEIPYLHAAAAAFGFGAPPVIDAGLEFSDDNISPEVAVNYHVNDDVSVFLAYKEGFKSGGIDNSALPTAALNPAVNGGDYSFLIYQSEEAKGFEVGMKGNFLDGSMRLNATAFTYEYSDLQVQLFNSTIIQFQTFNASALETQGLEFDMLWNTEIDGLSLRSAWAWTNTEYSDDFIVATGENLKGQDGAGTAEVTGFVGATLDRSLVADWRISLSADARYTGDYAWTATQNPLKQDAFWVVDAAISVYSDDGRHEFNLIGRNVGDEIYIIGGGAIPGRCPNANPAAGPFATCNNTGPNSLDQAATTPLGRTISLQYRFTL
jgi:iron complex outermembrane receptor protein